MTRINISSVTASIIGTLPLVTLDVLEAEINLDEYHAPYAEAKVTIAVPDLADLALLDPRSSPRLLLTYTDEQLEPTATTTTRTFDLLLQARDSDAGASTVTLTLVSDEQKLIDTSKFITNPVHTVTVASSLRAIINHVLGFYGAALEAGVPDADFTPTYDTANDLINPSVEVGVTGWLASSGTPATGARSTASFHSGAASFALTKITSVGDCAVLIGDNTNRTAVDSTTDYGRTASVWVRTPGVGRTVRLEARMYDAAGALQYIQTIDTKTSSSTWQQLAGTIAFAPEDATMILQVTVVGAAVNQIHYFDDALSAIFIQLAGTELPVSQFDGSKAADTYYTYSWEGTPNASRSLRTQKIPRDPRALVPVAGTKDWDYLNSFAQVAGLRFFCDEQRKWRLVDDTYTVAGTVTALTGSNVVSARDSISLREDYYDTVIVTYKWTQGGREQEISDTADAGLGSRMLLARTLTMPFPGYGAAASILQTSLARGRVQDIRMLTGLSATPGNAVETIIPNAPDQEGVLSAVTFLWAVEDGSSDEMTIRPRGLVNA